jgi:hypothetical protein
MTAEVAQAASLRTLLYRPIYATANPLRRSAGRLKSETPGSASYTSWQLALLSGVAGAAYGLNARNPILNRRQRRKRGMRLCLVPVCY